MFAHHCRWSTLVLPVLLLCLAACRTTSTTYVFEPSPAEAIVEAAPGGPTLARILVGVMGAERQGRRSGGHPELLVRIRVESKGPGVVRLDTTTVKVLGPDLASFGAPRFDGKSNAASVEVPSGEARDVLLRFPFPRNGDLRMPRLTGVNVSLIVETAAGMRDVSLGLQRTDLQDRYGGWNDYGTGYGYYYPYPGRPFGYAHMYYRGW